MTNSAPTIEEPVDDDAEFHSWVAFEVVLPIAVLLIAWVSAAYCFNINNAFVSTFGSGDVLPVTTLILLGCTVENQHFLAYNTVPRHRVRVLKQQTFNLSCVVLVALGFGAIKGAGLQALDVLSKSTDGSASKLWALAFASFGVGVLEVTLAWLSKTKLSEMKLEQAGAAR